MRIIKAAFLLLSTSSLALANSEEWKPHASFQLENGNLQQTMLFVSGMAYGLTEYTQQLEKNGKMKLICPPGKGLIQSPVIFEILNSKYSGQKISAEQATKEVFVGLRDRFPCK